MTNLSEGEREVLRFIGRNGIATLSQVRRACWSAASERTCTERLRKLVRAERLVQDWIDGAGRVYGLARAGAQLFGAGERRNLLTGLPPYTERGQQLLAQEVYLYLMQKTKAEGGRIVEWRNERQIRRSKNSIIKEGTAKTEFPDALAVVENGVGWTTTYEIEADGYYWGAMLAAKVAAYTARGQPVLWATVPRRVGRVRRELAEHDAQNIELLVFEELKT